MCSQIQNLRLIDVTPLSLGIEVEHRVMSTVIKRNTPIPCSYGNNFRTAHDNQAAVKVSVFEGEGLKVEDNHFLGTFDLAGIPPAPRGEQNIEVTFNIDADGILIVTAKGRATGNIEEITITDHRGRLTKAEIDSVLLDAERSREQTEIQRDRTAARFELENYIFLCNMASKKAPESGAKEMIKEKCSQESSWLDCNQNAGKSEYEQHLNELKRVCESIMMVFLLQEQTQGSSADSRLKIDEVD